MRPVPLTVVPQAEVTRVRAEPVVRRWARGICDLFRGAFRRREVPLTVYDVLLDEPALRRRR
jgi:hypothetical protein